MRQQLLDLPPEALRALQTRIGEITAEAVATSGYTQTVASRVTTGAGGHFVKAAPVGGDAALHQAVKLAQVVGALSPRVEAVVIAGGWHMVVFELLDGFEVAQWDTSTARELVELTNTLGVELNGRGFGACIPFGTHFKPLVGTWRELVRGEGRIDISHVRVPDMALGRLVSLEDQWDQVMVGNHLVHGDVRRDNLMKTSRGLKLVDWTHLWTGPGWMDLVGVMPDLAASGVDAWEVLASSMWKATPRRDIEVMLAGLAGYWLNASTRPALAHAPGLRALQHQSMENALALLG